MMAILLGLLALSCGICALILVIDLIHGGFPREERAIVTPLEARVTAAVFVVATAILTVAAWRW
jgi:hypothetical protein